MDQTITVIKVSKVDEVKGSIGQWVNDSKGQLGSEPEDQRIRGSEGHRTGKSKRQRSMGHHDYNKNYD